LVLLHYHAMINNLSRDKRNPKPLDIDWASTMPGITVWRDATIQQPLSSSEVSLKPPPHFQLRQSPKQNKKDNKKINQKSQNHPKKIKTKAEDEETSESQHSKTPGPRIYPLRIAFCGCPIETMSPGHDFEEARSHLPKPFKSSALVENG